MRHICLKFLVLLFSLNACSDTSTTNGMNIPSTEPNASAIVVTENKIPPTDIPPRIPYAACLEKIETKRKEFAKKYLDANTSNRNKIIDSASTYLEQTLLDSLIPYWYGTPWDFEGHTNQPNDGEIACGYFVSTTLKHFGFNLNRYKFAQQSAQNEAKTLQKTPLTTYRNLSQTAVVEAIHNDHQPGLYIVGLDYHVGYLLIEQDEVYFIHSNYCTDKVEKEIAVTSDCFASMIYVVGEISTNQSLIKKWILGEHIPIVMD